MVSRNRSLEWSGCWNVRDLGGLSAADGAATHWAAAVRADNLDGLTNEGWAAAWAHGVRTVIDLRNPDELGAGAAPRPDAITTIHLPLDATEDREFWDIWQSGPQFGTPLYYCAHLERFPERTAAVLAAIAHARPGGVAFHCVGGRDRTGQVTLVLLALLGVAPRTIADDYLCSYQRLPARYAARGEPDQGPALEAFLCDRGTSADELILETLRSLDIEATVRAGGLTDDDLTALRDRLLAPVAEDAPPRHAQLSADRGPERDRHTRA